MDDDENDKDEMLRNTVKSNDAGQKSAFCTKKTVIIIIIVSILIAAIITGIIFFFVLSDKDDNEDIAVLNGLLKRQFSEIKDRFEFKIEESNDTFFEISTSGSDPLKTKITIKGNHKLSLSSGLGYYLRYHALSQISWTGDSLKNILNIKKWTMMKMIKMKC